MTIDSVNSKTALLLSYKHAQQGRLRAVLHARLQALQWHQVQPVEEHLADVQQTWSVVSNQSIDHSINHDAPPATAVATAINYTTPGPTPTHSPCDLPPICYNPVYYFLRPEEN